MQSTCLEAAARWGGWISSGKVEKGKYHLELWSHVFSAGNYLGNVEETLIGFVLLEKS